MDRDKNGIKIETGENTKITKSKTDEKASGKGGHGNRADDPQKYAIYFNFNTYVNHIQPHQTLAINRAENLKARKTTKLYNRSVI